MDMIQTVLLTGATGFLGSRILEKLAGEGYTVIALTRPTSSFSRVEHLRDHPRIIWVDISSVSVDDLFMAHTVDAIIHTATAYGRNNESVSDILTANLLFPITLLEQGISHGVHAFINADTFFQEDMAFEGNEGWYVKTKKDFLGYAKRMVASTSAAFVNLTLFQMYGPRDASHKFIPFVIQEFLRDVPHLPLTPGEQTRDFVYVDDVADAFLSTIRHLPELSHDESFDIGSGEEQSIREVVEALQTLTGAKTTLGWGEKPYRTNEIMHSCADIAHNTRIGWQARTSLHDGLSETVSFYRT